MELPAEFERRMQVLLGEQWNAFTEARDVPLRRGLRINTVKTDPDSFRAVFPLPIEPSPFAADSFYLDADWKAGADPLHHAGGYYMQEPSAGSAVTVLAPRPGERVLDLCAAPGGKSTQIAAALRGTGLLWSHEFVPARARILEQNLERLGVRQRVVSTGDTARLCPALADQFDAVLVDAPCSGEGMFRKEPQALTMWSVGQVQLCAARQKEILHNAAVTVRPGGRLVYSTCTFAPEEDEAVVADFLHNHPDFRLVPIEVAWGCPGFDADTVRRIAPIADTAADLTGCRRIFPQHGGEGHFIALMHRDGTAQDTFPTAYEPPARDEHRQAAVELYSDCFTDTPAGVFVTVGETVRLLPPGLPALRGIGVLSAGIAVATVCRNRLEPCHDAFMASSPVLCRRTADLAPEDPRLTAYLRGEELMTEGADGWTAVTVAGMTVGYGKHAAGRLKNRYPKGLRLTGR